MKKEVAIIIPTYNRLDFLKNLLYDLTFQTNKSFIVIIVDASETNETQKYLKAFSQIDVKYVKVGNDIYWTGAINNGIRYVRSTLKEINGIISLNDDIRIEKDFFESIYFLKSSHKKSLIGCVNIDAIDKSTILWAGIKTHKWLGNTKYLYKNQQINDIEKQMIVDSFTLIGRGIYIPIKIFDEIGYYDEQHIIHRGDTEFPLRAKKVGYKLIVSFMPKVYIYSNQTYQFDHGKTKLKNFKSVFFDFRSSSYVKTRFYYAKSATSNKLQFLSFFTIGMMAHIRRFILRLMY